jgi:hypothetical protein
MNKLVTDPLGSVHPVYVLPPAAEFDASDIAEDLALVIDPQGWMLFRRNALAISLVRLVRRNGEEECAKTTIQMAQRLPRELLECAESFFEEAFQKYQSEAAAVILVRDLTARSPVFLPEDQKPDAVFGNWALVIPPQEVTSGHVDYENDAVAQKYPGWLLSGTIHSHARMKAFTSGTDDKDDFSKDGAHRDGVHITIGDLDVHKHSYHCSVCVCGTRYGIKLEELFTDFDTTTAHPAGWIDRVKKKETMGFYGGYTGGGYDHSSYVATGRKDESACSPAQQNNGHGRHRHRNSQGGRHGSQR